MSSSSALYSRLFVLICAAVMSLIMCSHAARVSRTIPNSHNGVQRSILRQVNTPHSHHHPLSAGLLSTENGLQTAPKRETETKRNLEEDPSVINRQSHATQYPQSYGQDNGQFGVRSLQRGGMRPASSIFTGHSQHGGQWQSRQNDYRLPQKEERDNSYSSVVVVKRQSLLNKTASFSHTLDHKHNQKFKVDEDKSVETSFYYPLVSPWINRNQNTEPPKPRGHHSGFKEIKELPAGGGQSATSGSQSVKVLRFTSHAAPRAAPPGSRLEDFNKRQPSQERWTPSNKDFSDRGSPARSGEVLGHNKIQSYLFKDSPTSNRLSRTEPNTQDGDDGRKESFTKHDPSNVHPASRITAPSSRASVEGKHLESFVPTSHEHSWDGHAGSDEQVVSSAIVRATRRESVLDYKPGQVTKDSQHPGGGFINPLRQLVKDTSGSSPTKTTNSGQSNLDKRRVFRLENANLNPYRSQKYNFGQRGAFATTPAPAKQERMDYSPPSPADLDIIEVTARSTSGSLAPGLESDVSTGRNPNQTGFKLYKGLFGLEGFGTQPLEGAKTLSPGPDTSVKRGFGGFKLRSLKTLRPKGTRIQKYHKTKPGSANISTASQHDDFKHPPNGPRMGFQPIRDRTGNPRNKTQWKYPVSSSGVLSSASLRPAGRVKAALSQTPGWRAAGRDGAGGEEVALKPSTSSIVRGKRVKLKPTSRKTLNRSTSVNANAVIVRGPRPPVGVKAVTYADIVGSTSFSSVPASNQTTDEDYSLNATTLQSDDGRNASRKPEGNAEVEDSLKGAEGNAFGEEEAGSEIQTWDLFLDKEGSGGGGFSLSDVVSAITESLASGADLSELDYLRMSTGNTSFTSALTDPRPQRLQ